MGEYAARRGVDVLVAVGDAGRGHRARRGRRTGLGTAWRSTTAGRDEALAWLRENAVAGDASVSCS